MNECHRHRQANEQREGGPSKDHSKKGRRRKRRKEGRTKQGLPDMTRDSVLGYRGRELDCDMRRDTMQSHSIINNDGAKGGRRGGGAKRRLRLKLPSLYLPLFLSLPPSFRRAHWRVMHTVRALAQGREKEGGGARMSNERASDDDAEGGMRSDGKNSIDLG